MNKFLFFLFLIVIMISVGSARIEIISPDDKSTKAFILTNPEAIVNNFLALIDTPSSYSGQGTLCAKVNGAENSIEFGSCGAGGGTSKDADGFYLFNTTSTIFFNDTLLNITIDSRLPDTNLSFNQTLTDTLYADISVTPGNLSFNQTLTDTLYSTGAHTEAGNLSFNQTLTDLLYADISVTPGNLSWNQTLADTLYSTGPHTTAGNLSFNQTLTDMLYSIGAHNGNLSWNQTAADLLYASIIFGYNQTLSTLEILTGNCGTTDKVSGIFSNGSLNCTTDVTGGGSDINYTAIALLNTSRQVFLGEQNFTTIYTESISIAGIADFWDGDELHFTGTALDVNYLADCDADNEKLEVNSLGVFFCGTNVVANLSFNQSLTDTLYANISLIDTNLSLGGDVFGSLNVSENITANDRVCFNSDCSSYIYFNGSGIIIK